MEESRAEAAEQTEQKSLREARDTGELEQRQDQAQTQAQPRTQAQSQTKAVWQLPGRRRPERILVCLSPAPANGKLICAAAEMAKAYDGAFSALFVETAEYAAFSTKEKAKLQENIHLAETLGAEMEIAHGDDVAFQIAEYARLSGVTKLLLGRSNERKRRGLFRPSLTEQIIAYAPNLEIHILPDKARSPYRKRERRQNVFHFSLRDTLITILALLVPTLMGYGFDVLGFSAANIITVYILSVLVLSVLTRSRIYGILASALSVLIFNFLFIDPRMSLAYTSGYPLTFAVMFISSFLTGSLASRLKNNAAQSARVAYRMQILLETNRLLQLEQDQKGIISVTAQQLIKLLARDLVFYPAKGKGLGEPLRFSRIGETEDAKVLSPNERAVAQWTFENNHQAGAMTDTLQSVKCMYLPVRTGTASYGVFGIVMGGAPLDAYENSILLSMLSECALALENVRIAREKEEAAVLAKNEQLRANLLRAISHDLRTPLTSISGNASNLIEGEGRFDQKTRLQLYRDIQDDAQWLIDLVENLLAITRAGEGRMQLHLSAELLDEVVEEALRHVKRKGKEHVIRFVPEEEFLLARMDARLIVQVLINLVDNAVKYTPPGSEILIRTRKRNHMVYVSVEDNGPGISDEAKKHVFEMFYTGANKVADSRRSLGLGLALCRTIINAHGGVISVRDNHPRGSIFTFSLPAEEVQLHE